jgi:calcineurin-like phosphoesterase family protein
MKYNFVGHVHNEWAFQKRDEAGSEVFLINVGVDCWNFMPVTLEEIMKGLKKWQLGRGNPV